MTDYAQLLNPEQLAAALAPDGPLLVLAAAGTGKTRTLVYRVAHLVERGVDPRRILLLTFTNRAAREMLARAREVAGEQVSGIWGGTFHHVANRILRRYAPRLGYPHAFAILDGDEQRTLMGQVLKARKLTAREFLKKEVVLSLISGARNRQLALADYLDGKLEDLKIDPAELIRVHDDYVARKQALQAMDFDDLLVNVLRLLRDHPDVLAEYRTLFRHVLVDEYQDTNPLQAELVELLAAECGNLTVVGDDFQCIYSWRGADFRNIMEFPKRHPDARIVKLERNYRSVPGILEIANACIAGNPDQFQKTLRPTRPAAARLPRRLTTESGSEQAQMLLQLVREYRRKGYAYGDMAVLYRAHFHSIEIQMEFAREHLPHRLTSGVGFFEQAHVKDVLSLFRVAEYPDDRLAFDRLIGLLTGAGPSATEKLWGRLGGRFEAGQAPVRETLRNAMSPKLREQWRPIHHLLEVYADPRIRPNASGVVDAFLSGFYREYLAHNFDNPAPRLEDLTALGVQMERSSDVRSFLSDVALLTNVDQAGEQARSDDASGRVTLGTVHQAKGLEWPVVFVPWAVEGLFPSSRSLAEDTAGGDAEERRLFYVAVTRARDDLVLCTPRLRFLRDGQVYPCEPSRFVKEIPGNLLTEVGGHAATRYGAGAHRAREGGDRSSWQGHPARRGGTARHW